MENRISIEEAEKWLQDNWSKLYTEGKLIEALRRFFKTYRRPYWPKKDEDKVKVFDGMPF